MPSFFSGVRSFVEALRKGADNIVNNMIEQGSSRSEIEYDIGRRFPDLGAMNVDQVIDFTNRSRAFGDRVNSLSPRTRIDNAGIPLNPGIAVGPVYWVDVIWDDPLSGSDIRHLVVLRSRTGETKAQFERRALETFWEWVEDSLPGGNAEDHGKRTVKSIDWLRGYKGTGT